MAGALEEWVKCRPPSEAHSLLIRVTKNCPYNRCLFCGVYKGERFARRSLDEVIQAIAWHRNSVDPASIRSVFLGDSDTLLLPTVDLRGVLSELHSSFPNLRSVSSYARAHTIATRKSLDEMRGLREAGLTLVYIGLESGHDRVLGFMKKGATQEQMIEAGRKVKEAGMQLSEYVILGLGGRDLMAQHIEGTVYALNMIAPDFIRFRTLIVAEHTPLHELRQKGLFQPTSPLEKVLEQRQMIEGFRGITSTVQCNQVSNFLEVEGRLPQDRPSMLAAIDRFVQDYQADSEVREKIARYERAMEGMSRLRHESPLF